MFADSGAELKKPVNVVVDPSPVADSLVNVGADPAVAKVIKVDPSAQPSYAPVVVLNLIIPVAPVGLFPVVPTGNLTASVESDKSKSYAGLEVLIPT